jgi:hypothetical protein
MRAYRLLPRALPVWQPSCLCYPNLSLASVYWLSKRRGGAAERAIMTLRLCLALGNRLDPIGGLLVKAA